MELNLAEHNWNHTMLRQLWHKLLFSHIHGELGARGEVCRDLEGDGPARDAPGDTTARCKLGHGWELLAAFRAWCARCMNKGGFWCQQSTEGAGLYPASDQTPAPPRASCSRESDKGPSTASSPQRG